MNFSKKMFLESNKSLKKMNKIEAIKYQINKIVPL